MNMTLPFGNIPWNKGKKTQPLSEEHKLKISNANKGHITTKETRKKIGLAGKKRIQSLETRDKIRKSLIGRKQSEEIKMKRRKPYSDGRIAGMLGKKHTDETKSRISKANSGGKSHLYKDGRSSNKVYINWIKNKRNRLKRATINKFGGHTFGEWEQLKKQYGFTCPCCYKPEPEISLTEDHIIPLSKGGSDLIENIQPLCLKCNITKHTKSIKYILC